MISHHTTESKSKDLPTTHQASIGIKWARMQLQKCSEYAQIGTEGGYLAMAYLGKFAYCNYKQLTASAGAESHSATYLTHS